MLIDMTEDEAGLVIGALARERDVLTSNNQPSGHITVLRDRMVDLQQTIVMESQLEGSKIRLTRSDHD